MNPLVVKVAELFGAFKPVQNFLQGKKTIISAIGGILGSAAGMIVPTLAWIDGKIDANTYLNQITPFAMTFWASVTFLFSAFHAKNVVKAEAEKLGPAK